MTRRSLFTRSALGLGAVSLASAAEGKQARYKQGVARWCLGKMPLDDLARESARLGIKGIDLIGAEDWPAVQKHGLVPSLAPGAGSIPDGFNRVENHARLEQELRANLAKAAAAGVPNVIVFSGNRRGMDDRQALENCVTGLSRVKAMAEDKGVTVVMELLNSKVDHKDYQADHTAWGAEICRRVNSPRIKLLYDIYHMQIMEGDLIRTIRENIQWIGHFHTGGNPGRHELDGGQEINYRAVAQAIASSGYSGFVSHEFIPVRDPLKSLAEAVEIFSV